MLPTLELSKLELDQSELSESPYVVAVKSWERVSVRYDASALTWNGAPHPKLSKRSKSFE